MKHLLAFALTSCLLTACGSSASPGEAAKQPEAATAVVEGLPQNTITAPDLMATYQQNEVQADGYFKDKRFIVTGDILEIKKDLAGAIYITLATGDTFRSVQCYFNNPVVAGRLRRGWNAQFKGTCDGLMGNVLMKDCQLLGADGPAE